MDILIDNKLQAIKEPLVSCCMISYNQEHFIKNAVEALLTQSFDDIEVVISDDCSSDNTFEAINKIIKPNIPFSVKINCNKVNQGINANVNTIDALCNGQFVVISAGDDISLPDRVEKLVEQWKVGAVGVFSNAEIIDAQGNVKRHFMHKGYRHLATWREMIVVGSHGAWGSTFSWDKKVFDLFGPLPLNILGEDAIIPFRCALLGGVAYVDEVLVQYRDHGANVSFWAQIKQVSGKALMQIGEKIIQFDLLMYKNWRVDLHTAVSLGLISIDDVKWAEEHLTIHECIRNAQLELLHRSLLQALLICIKTLWSKRAIKESNLWTKRLVGTLLQFHMPLCYKIVLHLRGRSRG